MAKRTPSQVGRFSRCKGKRFELQIAHVMSKATGTKWETTRNSGRTDLIGDVYEVNNPYKTFIECKHRTEYDIQSMLRGTKSFVDMINFNTDKFFESDYKDMFIFNKTNIGIYFCYFYKIPECNHLSVLPNSKHGNIIVISMYGVTDLSVCNWVLLNKKEILINTDSVYRLSLCS